MSFIIFLLRYEISLSVGIICIMQFERQSYFTDNFMIANDTRNVIRYYDIIMIIKRVLECNLIGQKTTHDHASDFPTTRTVQTNIPIKKWLRCA